MKKTLRNVFIAASTLLLGASLNAQITIFPHNEDFESFTACGTSCTSTCTLANGWTNESSGGDNADWLTDAGGTSSSLTGPNGVDFNPGTSTGKYLYFETSSPCNGGDDSTILYSPALDLTGVSAMDMIFAYHMYGSTMGTLRIDVSADGGGTWINNLWSLSGDQTDMWHQDTVSLSAFAGTTSNLIVRFVGISGSSFYSDMAIDDITFFEPLANDAGVAAVPSPGLPSCNLTNANVTATFRNFGYLDLTSVTVNWAVNGTAQTPVAWTGTLAPNADSTIALGTYSFTDGDLLEVWTTLPNGITETGSGPFNDSTNINILEGMSGTYTVGATGDYLTFNDAVADLNFRGVCSAVTFNVQDGIYNESLALVPVAGANQTNTITFQSLNADPALVTLTDTASLSTENYTIFFDGASYFHFNDMTITNGGTTYSRVLSFDNNTMYNSFSGNVIQGDTAATTTSNLRAVIFANNGSLDDFTTFMDNEVLGGSYGIYWYGVNTTSKAKGLHLEGNNFTDSYYRAAYLYYNDSVNIIDNYFATNGNYSSWDYVVYTYYMTGPCTFANNDIYVPGYGYAWYASQCDAPPTVKSRAYNNTFVVEDSVSTSTSYGMYFTGSDNWIISNNSVNIISQGTTSRAAYFSGGGMELYSNNLRNDGPGYGIYYSSGLTGSDYNNIYVPNGKVGYFSGDQTTLTDWQNASFLDMNSVSGDPGYFSSTDLHTCNDTLLDGAGMVDMMIMYDMDGQVRDTNAFDIGADEFLGLVNLAFADDTVTKCSQDAVTLGGWEPMDDATYLWSTTETTPTIDASAAGFYTVTVTTGCGSTVASIEVENLPDAAADFTSSVSFMTGSFFDNSTGTYSSVLWDFGDGNTSTSANPIHIYNATGTYTVTLTVTGPCGTDTFTQDVVIEIADLDENELGSALNVFPNPNNGEFELTVTLDNATNVSAVLVDARGQQVWNTEMGAVNGTASETINVSNNAAGVYFLKVTADDISTVRKVVIKK